MGLKLLAHLLRAPGDERMLRSHYFGRPVRSWLAWNTALAKLPNVRIRVGNYSSPESRWTKYFSVR